MENRSILAAVFWLCASVFVFVSDNGSQNGVGAGNDGFDGDNVHFASGDDVFLASYDGHVFERIDESHRQRDYSAFKFESVALPISVLACRKPVLYPIPGIEPLFASAPNQAHRYWFWFAH